MLEFKLPEVGENITSGTVVSILVKPGDTITKNQDLLELETDKASLPVPAPATGIVKEIFIKEGTDVDVGAVIMTIETSDALVAPISTPTKTTPKDNSPSTAALNTSTVAAPQPATTMNNAPEDLSDIHVAVIGGGPGGYVAAFLAADLGMKVTLIDKDINPGGVCLYRGCIPSKALLHAAKVISEAREAKSFGVTFGEPKIDLKKLRGWKESVVDRLTGGLGQLTKQRKITYIQGTATFTDASTLAISKNDGSTQTLKYTKAILATGSSPIKLPFAPESKRILDSTSALALDNIPKSMLLVGGGYIGLELGMVYAELGCKVSVVEMMPQLMTGADRDLASVLEKRLKTIMDTIMVSTKVTKMEEKSNGIAVSFEDKKGKAWTETYEKVLVAIGRKPNSKNLGLDNTQVQVDERGFVTTNAQLQTHDPAIYAIGDIAGNPMLAHKASHEGRVAVEHIAGHKVAFEPKAIPAVVFTDPEIAWAGLTETEAKEQGRAITVVKFPWGASGRAITLDRTDGLTKLIIDPDTQQVLGVAIVGPGAGEMIAEGTLAIEMGAVVEDLKLTIHPHPTLTETIMESAELFFNQCTHIYKPKKK